MKRATLVGLLALAVAALLALPGSALASGHGHHGTHANRGNHCGQGHAKHSRKVGQSCQKLSRHSTNANGAVNPGDDNEAGDDQDQAGDNNDQDQAGDDQGEVNDDQGDVADDDQGDVADDQGDDAQGG